jgi:uncharacterized repeat protein (TIGR01451 family)
MTILRASTVAVLAVAALALPALPVALASPAAAAQNPTRCSATTSVINGGFETPALTPGSWNLFTDADVPGWRTTAGDGLFEFWGDGYHGVPAAEGNGFAELNANDVSTFYQDVATTPGTTLQWSLQHRGRSGVDTLRVLVGDPAGVLIPSGPDLSDGNGAWGLHTNTYVVPPGQTMTRFAFESVSAAGGDPTFGNFLDAVSFGTAPCLITSKSVQNLSQHVPAVAGDRFRYTIKVANRGGIDAQLTAVTDVLPAGLEYLPGTLVITSGTGAGPLTDAPGDDAGDYDLATRTLRVRLGTGADAVTGGSIPARTSVTFRFEATPTADVTARTIGNTASATYVDPLTGAILSSTSQTAVMDAAAELSATGGTISPLQLPSALLLIGVGVALVAWARRGMPRHRV